MISVRPLTDSDIETLGFEDYIAQRYSAYVKTDNPMFIVEDERGALCAFGASLYWTGVYECWFRLIDKRNIKAQIRILKQFINEWSEKLNIRRLFATAKCDAEISCRFLEFLGFKGEQSDGSPVCKQKFMPDGSSAYEYALVR